jgi:ABC-type lipoprotein export system ATPase subunit
MEIFSQLWQGGRTILMVTHDPAIAAFSKSTIRLLDGAVQANGAVH